MALLVTLVAFVCCNAGMVHSHDSQVLRTVGEVTEGVPYTGDIGGQFHAIEMTGDDLQHISRRGGGIGTNSAFLTSSKHRSGNSEEDE